VIEGHPSPTPQLWLLLEIPPLAILRFRPRFSSQVEEMGRILSLGENLHIGVDDEGERWFVSMTGYQSAGVALSGEKENHSSGRSHLVDTTAHK